MNARIGSSSALRVSSVVLLIIVVLLSVNIYIIFHNIQHFANIDVLYTSIQNKFIYSNKEGYITEVSCRNLNDCIDKLINNISISARGIVSYNSIFNFTAYPVDSIQHYTKDNYYISGISCVIILILSFIGFIVNITSVSRL